MKTETTVKTWEKTRLQNLVRHKSGRYYARLYLNGKEVWKSLKTSHFSVAEARLGAAVKEHRERRGTNTDSTSAKMTFVQAAAIHLKQLEGKASIKKATRHYWNQISKALLKKWPELGESEIRKLTPSVCREGLSKFVAVSPTRYNNTLAFFRQVMEVAIESGVIYSNPATKLERKAVRQKKLELPSKEQFATFVQVIATGGGRHSQNCADFAQGLAFTGCRVSEAAKIQWRDLDFAHGEILVKGDEDDATKNGEIRRVPMIAQASALFRRMRAKRRDESPDGYVFKVQECQKSMDKAAKKVAMARITHHDLRHFFATVCIESGVDIQTVSRWLGHKDGGVLAMKTYGHLRREHSLAQAKKVTFVPDKKM